MILVKILGGLGNQLFEYAAGRALAIRCGAKLGLDVRFYEKQTSRSFVLDRLKIKADRISARDVSSFIEPSWDTWRGRLAFRLNWLGIQKFPAIIRDRMAGFQPEVLTAPRRTYLDGYWQSYRYFESYWSTIAKEVAPQASPTLINRNAAQHMRSSESVAVHVRRGDYVTVKGFADFHGTCDLEYYKNAFAMISEKVNNANYFLFSDDPVWTIANIHPPGPYRIIDWNDVGAEQWDMWLMSQCRHHIIANSTFSWWGAWMNQDLGKVVVAPKRWSLNPAGELPHFIPSSWIRL